MKHKIEIYRGVAKLWYVHCACTWAPSERAPSRLRGGNMYGRDTWDAAFAQGVAHQQNVNGRGEDG